MGLLRTFITALRHYLRGRNRVHIVGDGELHIAPDASVSAGAVPMMEKRCLAANTSGLTCPEASIFVSEKAPLSITQMQSYKNLFVH